MSINCDYIFIKGARKNEACNKKCVKYSGINKCNLHGSKIKNKFILPSELVDLILTTLPIKKLTKINKYYNNYKYHNFCDTDPNENINDLQNKNIDRIRIDNPYSGRKKMYKYVNVGVSTVLHICKINGHGNYFYTGCWDENKKDTTIPNIIIPKKIFNNLIKIGLGAISVNGVFKRSGISTPDIFDIRSCYLDISYRDEPTVTRLMRNGPIPYK
jgi:hypothetical protein